MQRQRAPGNSSSSSSSLAQQAAAAVSATRRCSCCCPPAAAADAAAAGAAAAGPAAAGSGAAADAVHRLRRLSACRADRRLCHGFPGQNPGSGRRGLRVPGGKGPGGSSSSSSGSSRPWLQESLGNNGWRQYSGLTAQQQQLTDQQQHLHSTHCQISTDSTSTALTGQQQVAIACCCCRQPALAQLSPASPRASADIATGQDSPASPAAAAAPAALGATQPTSATADRQTRLTRLQPPPPPPQRPSQQQQQQQREQAAKRQRGSKAAPPAVLLVLSLLVVLLGLGAQPAAGQQPMPFQGQGDAPPATPTDVYVTAFVDRLLNVDDNTYEFTAVIWFYLSWRDGRVKQQIADNEAKLRDPNSTYTCEQPCQSNMKVLAGGCCDGVWTPYIAFSNLKWLPQDRVVRYGLGFIPENDGVFQWRSVHATYFTPMDLRAFPFDKQQLLVQLEVPQARVGWSGGLVNLLPSTTGDKLFTAKTGGDDVSGWGVVDVRLSTFEYPLCQATMSGALGPSNPNDPAPVVPQYMWQSGARIEPASCAAELSSDIARGRKSPFWRHPLAGVGTVPQRPVPVSGLNLVIVVQRFTTRWILSAIFPIMATTWLGFLVFFLPRDDMNGRLGSIVALFLALAAIQFVVDSDVPSSSYITPLQQLTLASYLSLILVGLECVIIWYVTTYHAEKLRTRRHHEAQQNYEAKLAAVRAALDAWFKKARGGYDAARGYSRAAGSFNSAFSGGVSGAGSGSLPHHHGKSFAGWGASFRRIRSKAVKAPAGGSSGSGAGRTASGTEDEGHLESRASGSGGGGTRLLRGKTASGSGAGSAGQGRRSSSGAAEVQQPLGAAAAAAADDGSAGAGSDQQQQQQCQQVLTDLVDAGAGSSSGPRPLGEGFEAQMGAAARSAATAQRAQQERQRQQQERQRQQQQQQQQQVKFASDSPEGEVRLVVSNPPTPAPGRAAAAAGARFRSSGDASSSAAGDATPLQSAESMQLAEAAAQAAMAAAALAESEAGGAVPGGPLGAHTYGSQGYGHRTGLLRFMRSSSPSAAAAGSGTAHWESVSPGTMAAAIAAAAREPQQQQRPGGVMLQDLAAAGEGPAAGPPGAVGGPRAQTPGSPDSPSGSMADVVTSMMAASQGGNGGRGAAGSVSGSSVFAGGAGGGGGAGLGPRPSRLSEASATGSDRGAAGVDPADLPQATGFVQRWQLFLQMVADDDAFADRLGHRANKWCAISQLVMYNLAAVLIFALNSLIYGRV